MSTTLWIVIQAYSGLWGAIKVQGQRASWWTEHLDKHDPNKSKRKMLLSLKEREKLPEEMEAEEGQLRIL